MTIKDLAFQKSSIYDCLILSSAIGLLPEEIFKRHAWLMKPTAKRAVHAAPRKRRRASTARKRIFSLKIQRVKRLKPLCSNEARVESHTVVVKVLPHLDTENTWISDHKLSTGLQATWAPNVRSTGHVWPVPSQLWQFSAHWETSRTSQKLMEEGSLGGKLDAKMKAGYKTRNEICRILSPGDVKILVQLWRYPTPIWRPAWASRGTAEWRSWLEPISSWSGTVHKPSGQ